MTEPSKPEGDRHKRDERILAEVDDYLDGRMTYDELTRPDGAPAPGPRDAEIERLRAEVERLRVQRDDAWALLDTGICSWDDHDRAERAEGYARRWKALAKRLREDYEECFVRMYDETFRADSCAEKLAKVSAAARLAGDALERLLPFVEQAVEDPEEFGIEDREDFTAAKRAVKGGTAALDALAKAGVR